MANELSDAERMTKFETQLENLVLVVTRMDAKMDSWQASFVSKELLEEKLKSRDEKIERLETEKTSYKNNLPFWATFVVSSIALIYSFWPRK